MTNNNILVTGANGFLGNALWKKLLEDKSNNVILLSRQNNYDLKHYNFNGLTNAHNVTGDINNYDFIREVISRYEINQVYHCAAQSIVRKCAEDPVSAYETTVMGTVKLLETIRTVGMNNIKSIVISTSDKAFGHSEPPYDEETPLRPKYTYEATKSCQDIIGQNYFHNYGLPVKIMRCSNIYGPGDPNVSRLIPNTIIKIANKQKPILYSGVGEYIREFIYIDDVVNAFLLVAEKGTNGEAYCVGDGLPYKISNVLKKICTHMKWTDGVDIVEKVPTFKEINSQYMNPAKLQNLGWIQRVSLDEGLKKSIEYYTSLYSAER